MTDHLYFEPRRGKHYGKKSGFGIPLMIMGESHYGRNPSPDWNKEIIEQVIRGDGKKKFIFHANISAAFLGKRVNTVEERREFWNSVLFYNYVQELVGPNSRSRPTRAMLKKAETPFLDTVAKYKPKLIAVFGYTAWESTPSWGKDVESITVGSRTVQCYEFKVGSTKAWAPKLLHASRGFSPKKWHPVIVEALRLAGGHEFGKV